MIATTGILYRNSVRATGNYCRVQDLVPRGTDWARMTPETPGQRLFLVRLACGDGIRTAEPMTAFAGRVKRVTGATYHPNAISLLERGGQNWKLEDINNFAAVDPKNRGPAWLAWGDAPTPVLLDPTKDRGLTEEEEERALRASELLAAAQKSRSAKKRR